MAVSAEDKIVRGGDLATIGVQVKAKLAEKQDTLVSGTNIKSINNTSLLGSGDITIHDGEDGASAYELWIAAGHTGTVDDFLESLKGDTGVQIDEETFMGTIVNDLTTGGADKALSAQAGKGFHYDVYGYDTLVMDETNILPADPTSGWRISNGGDTLTATAMEFFSQSYNSFNVNTSTYGGKVLKIKGNASAYTYMFFLKKIPSTDSSPYTFNELIEGDYFSSIHFDDENNFTKVFTTADTEITIVVPEDTIRLYISSRVIENTTNRNPQYVYLGEYVHTDGTVDVINRAIDELQDESDNISDSVQTLDNTVFGTEQTVSKDGLILAKTVKCSIDSGTFYRSVSQQRGLMMDVSGIESITITAGAKYAYFCIAKNNLDINASGNISGSTFASTYMATGCDGYTPSGSSNYRMSLSPGDSATITLSSNAKWLIVQKNYTDTSKIYTPSSVVMTESKLVGGLVDAIGNMGNSVAGTTLISLVQGYFSESGSFVDDSHFVTTSPVPLSRGFCFEVREPYRIHGVMLFDNNGNLVNSRDYYNSIDSPNNGGTRYSIAVILPQFNVRFRIGTSVPEGTVSPNDNIISRLIYLDDGRLHRMVPTDQGTASVHGIAKRRAKTLTNVVWTALENANITSGSTNYAKKGQVMRGIPYSEAAEYTKYVGQHISTTTFLTATLNKRSVVYTEFIGITNASSKYGLSYHGLSNLSGAYYGTVCSGLTCFVQALSDIITSGTHPNCVRIAGGDDSSEGNYYPLVDGTTDPFDLIEPLDLIWYTGHIAIITDVYLDDNGDKKLIDWTEQVIPRTTSSIYTREKFKKRLVEKMQDDDRHGWAIYRYSKWGDGLPEPESSPYVQRDFFDYAPEKDLSIDSDISTFAGEYAAFSIGNPSDIDNNNKLFLNIHRGGSDGYTHLQIFNESDDETTDTPVVELGILQSDDYVSQSTIYTDDASDKEDWINYDLASYWYTSRSSSHGKFKARVVRKESSSVVRSSGCTHFQMVDISFSATRHSSSIDFSFSSTEGSCYLIRQEKNDGMANNKVEVSGSGSTTQSWSSFGTYNYVKLFVRADYGVVVKRIDASQLTVS